MTDTVGLKELIASGDIVVDAFTLNNINGNSLSNPTGLPVDGTSCNDNNPLTTNDIYTNNVCLGTNIVGTSCDDNNAQTSNDKYNDMGVCVGSTLHIVEFKTIGNFTWVVPNNVNKVDILVVAGGRAGGLIYIQNKIVTSNSSLSLSVGAGGNGGGGACTNATGQNGETNSGGGGGSNGGNYGGTGGSGIVIIRYLN